MIREFLKPNWKKVSIFIILILLIIISSSWFRENVIGFRIIGTGALYKIGLPLKFYHYETSSPLPGIEHWTKEDFKLSYLLIDIITWYLFSCLIIRVYDKFRRNK